MIQRAVPNVLWIVLVIRTFREEVLSYNYANLTTAARFTEIAIGALL